MDKPMTAAESYIERRQLFKTIWETAMNIDEKDGEVLNKPKVIKVWPVSAKRAGTESIGSPKGQRRIRREGRDSRSPDGKQSLQTLCTHIQAAFNALPTTIKIEDRTLRLDSVDRSAGRKKKQRLKNLRTVCNKILDFCDKQDADELYYQKIVTGGNASTLKENAPKKFKGKIRKRVGKMKKCKSMYVPTTETTQARATTSERRSKGKSYTTTDLRTIKSKQTSPSANVEPAMIRKLPTRPVKSPTKVAASVRASIFNNNINPPRRKVVQKNNSKVVLKQNSKRKNARENPIPATGTLTRRRKNDTRTAERASVEPPKRMIKMHKITL